MLPHCEHMWVSDTWTFLTMVSRRLPIYRLSTPKSVKFLLCGFSEGQLLLKPLNTVWVIVSDICMQYGYFIENGQLTILSLN